VAWLLAGDLAGGIWFAFIGWFLVQAARSSYQELQLRDLLRGVEAEDVMAGNLRRIPPQLSLQPVYMNMFLGRELVRGPLRRLDRRRCQPMPRGSSTISMCTSTAREGRSAISQAANARQSRSPGQCTGRSGSC
jgi:hypothetical protein